MFDFLLLVHVYLLCAVIWTTICRQLLALVKWHNLWGTNRGSPLQVVNNNLRIIEENLRTLESEFIDEQQISGDAAECQSVIMSILRMKFQQVNNTFKQLKELRKKKQKEKVFFDFTSSYLFRMILVWYYSIWIKWSSSERMLPLETIYGSFHKFVATHRDCSSHSNLVCHKEVKIPALLHYVYVHST